MILSAFWTTVAKRPLTHLPAGLGDSSTRTTTMWTNKHGARPRRGAGTGCCCIGCYVRISTNVDAIQELREAIIDSSFSRSRIRYAVAIVIWPGEAANTTVAVTLVLGLFQQHGCHFDTPSSERENCLSYTSVGVGLENVETLSVCWYVTLISILSSSVSLACHLLHFLGMLLGQVGCPDPQPVQ